MILQKPIGFYLSTPSRDHTVSFFIKPLYGLRAFSSWLHPEDLEAFLLGLLGESRHSRGSAEDIQNVDLIRDVVDGGIDLLTQNGPVGVIGVYEIELEAVALQDIGYKVAGLVGVGGDADDADGAAALKGIFQVLIFSKDGHGKTMVVIRINNLTEDFRRLVRPYARRLPEPTKTISS